MTEHLSAEARAAPGCVAVLQRFEKRLAERLQLVGRSSYSCSSRDAQVSEVQVEGGCAAPKDSHFCSEIARQGDVKP